MTLPEPAKERPGLSRDEVDAAERLAAGMTGWLFRLTDTDIDRREQAEAKLAAAAEKFQTLNTAQREHFFDKLYLNPANLRIALKVLVAFGLANLPASEHEAG